jgi:hypothetical protein
MANPVRHELLLWMDEPQLGALEVALVDPTLARRETPDEERLARSLERSYAGALRDLRGGVRPSGLDLFRCQTCNRIYAVFAP